MSMRLISEEQASIIRRIDVVQSQVSLLSSKVSALSDEIRAVKDDLKVIGSRVRYLEQSVHDLRKELNETRRGLEYRIEKVRQELEEEIDSTRRILEERIEIVEKMINKTREELDNHLTAQDHIINISKEGILNVATIQTVLTILQSNPADHAVVCQVDGKPMIVVDKGDSVQIVLISEEPSGDDKALVEELCNLIKYSTGKEVRGTTVSAVREKSEKPIWIANVESIIS